MLKPNLGWVTGKTEPKENLENWINGKFTSQPVFWVKCRKVTMHKCPWINVLNIETKPRMGERENWKLKNGRHFININHSEKFQITDPPKSLGLWFSNCQQKWNICVGHYEKIEKWPPFHKYRSFGSLVYPTSHLCVVLHFQIFIAILLFDTNHLWSCTMIESITNFSLLAIAFSSILYSTLGKVIGLRFLSLLESLVGFGIRLIVPFKAELGILVSFNPSSRHSLLSIFHKTFSKNALTVHLDQEFYPSPFV